MEIFVGVVFLAIVLTLLNQRVQTRLKLWFYEQPLHIFLVSWMLAMFACAAAAPHSAINPDFRFVIPLIFAYTFAPAFLFYNMGSWRSHELTGRSWIEFCVILILWLPVEIAIGQGWLREYFGRATHIVAYGTAVTLGLFLFLLFGQMRGLKYNLPRSRRDFILPLCGLLVAALILIRLGRFIGFLGPLHVPADLSAFKIAMSFVAIIFGVALPEEILFRSLVQNWLMQKLGPTNKTLFLSALIFGASHLNNFSKPRDGTITGSPPNWEYALVATVAGFIYGKVFQKSNSVFSSAGLHAVVNTIRHTFFA